MNKLSDYCISENLELVNNSLAGKTIKRLFDSTKKRVMIEFSDGSNGMIEVLKQQSNGEEFLSVMPPVSQANKLIFNFEIIFGHLVYLINPILNHCAILTGYHS